MGQDVAIFRSLAHPPDRICCIGGGDSDSERCHCTSALGAFDMAANAVAKIVGLIGDQMAEHDAWVAELKAAAEAVLDRERATRAKIAEIGGGK